MKNFTQLLDETLAGTRKVFKNLSYDRDYLESSSWVDYSSLEVSLEIFALYSESLRFLLWLA